MIDIANVKEIAASDAIADMLRKYKFVTGALFNTDVSDDYTFQDAYWLLKSCGRSRTKTS